MLLSVSLATVAVVYAAFVGWCAWRVAYARGPVETTSGALPRIAVLVAARDEEATIERCINALLAQDYPTDRIEILVADDHSTDSTAAIVQRYVSGERSAPEAVTQEAQAVVRYVRVPEPEDALCGKPLAIHTASQQTDADVFLVTDADCEPPPGWARGLVSSMEPDTGLTGGLTQMGNRTPFEGAQSLDWAYLLGVASALTEAGIPGTIMGNNIAVRREAYESVGGYQGIPFSVTEDYALFKAVSETGRWRVRFPLRADTLVQTQPARSFSHAYRQRRRWAKGGMQAGPVLWSAYVLAHLAHLIPLLGLVLSPLAGLAAFTVKLSVDAVHVRAVRRRTGSGIVGLLPFLTFEAFLFLYMTTLPLALLVLPRIRWKGRTH